MTHNTVSNSVDLLCELLVMVKFLCTLNSYKTEAEAVYAAEGAFQATRGMFMALEGSVWISYGPAFGYQLWIIETNSIYIPSRDELWDACEMEGIPLMSVMEGRTLRSWNILTTNKVVKWKRFN